MDAQAVNAAGQVPNKRIEQNATGSAVNRQVSRVCSCAVR
jgi:hypothetical protein